LAQTLQRGIYRALGSPVGQLAIETEATYIK
jgi:hypothetical protein